MLILEKLENRAFLLRLLTEGLSVRVLPEEPNKIKGLGSTPKTGEHPSPKPINHIIPGSTAERFTVTNGPEGC
jgi:hypothetical protein